MSTQPIPQSNVTNFSVAGLPIVPEIQKVESLIHIQTNKANKLFLWTSHYVKTHEKFLAVVLGLALVWGVTGKGLDLITAHDQRKFNAATTAQQAQVAANAALAEKNATLATQYQAMAQQAQAQNAQLEKSSAALSSALQKQKATDTALPPSDLAARIVDLAALPADSVKPQAGNTFAVTDAGAVGIAQTLENVPVLQQQIVNVQQEKAIITQLLAQQTTRVDSLNATVAGKDLQIAADNKAHKDELKLVKDNAAKGKRKWFVAGYVAGLATRAAIKIFGGV